MIKGQGLGVRLNSVLKNVYHEVGIQSTPARETICKKNAMKGGSSGRSRSGAREGMRWLALLLRVRRLLLLRLPSLDCSKRHCLRSHLCCLLCELSGLFLVLLAAW